MPTKPYNREKAVEYAHRWAYSRNPNYYDFSEIGGDCTNFISQTIYAGAGVMNVRKETGWYYFSVNNRSPSWSGVDFLYSFLTGNRGAGPSAAETSMEIIEPGDILQLAFDFEHYGHSLTVVSAGTPPTPENILLCTHTYDADYRPLSTYEYSRVRFLHMLDVKL